MPSECYWCEREGLTREHVPPQCLFPELKDAGGRHHRRDLITVPACDEHNSKKSKDDEFLMAALSGVVGVNPVGYRQTTTKVRRALDRTPSLLGRLIQNPQHLMAVDPSGVAYPVIVGKPDLPRLLRCLEGVARGLWHHRVSSRFVGECVVMPAFLSFDPTVTEGRNETLKILARILIEHESANWPRRGANPEVFVYQFGPVDQFGLTPLRMTFFEGVDVFVSFIPAGIEPPHRRSSLGPGRA